MSPVIVISFGIPMPKIKEVFSPVMGLAKTRIPYEIDWFEQFLERGKLFGIARLKKIFKPQISMALGCQEYFDWALKHQWAEEWILVFFLGSVL